MTGAEGLNQVGQVLDRVDADRGDVDIQVRLGAIDLVRIQAFRVQWIALPHGENAIDVRMEQEHERVAERIVRADVGEIGVRRIVDVLPGRAEELTRIEGAGIRGSAGAVVHKRQDLILLGCGDERRRGWSRIVGRPRDELGRIGRSAAGGVAILWVTGRAGQRVVEARAEPGISNLPVSGIHDLNLWESRRAHEQDGGIEQVECSIVPSAEIGILQGAGILLEVPVVERELGIDLPDECFEAVGELAMPRQELRAPMHVRGLMDLVLFEPPAHAPRRHVAPAAREVPVVQLLDRIAQHGAFRRIDSFDVSPDSISQCHLSFPP